MIEFKKKSWWPIGMKLTILPETIVKRQTHIIRPLSSGTTESLIRPIIDTCRGSHHPSRSILIFREHRVGSCEFNRKGDVRNGL